MSQVDNYRFIHNLVCRPPYNGSIHKRRHLLGTIKHPRPQYNLIPRRQNSHQQQTGPTSPPNQHLLIQPLSPIEHNILPSMRGMNMSKHNQPGPYPRNLLREIRTPRPMNTRRIKMKLERAMRNHHIWLYLLKATRPMIFIGGIVLKRGHAIPRRPWTAVDGYPSRCSEDRKHESDR